MQVKVDDIAQSVSQVAGEAGKIVERAPPTCSGSPSENFKAPSEQAWEPPLPMSCPTWPLVWTPALPVSEDPHRAGRGAGGPWGHRPASI